MRIDDRIGRCRIERVLPWHRDMRIRGAVTAEVEAANVDARHYRVRPKARPHCSGSFGRGARACRRREGISASVAIGAHVHRSDGRVAVDVVDHTHRTAIATTATIFIFATITSRSTRDELVASSRSLHVTDRQIELNDDWGSRRWKIDGVGIDRDVAIRIRATLSRRSRSRM